jgi:hypothetical protein
MGIRDAAGDQYLSFGEGVDNTTAIGSEELKGTLSIADNTDLVDESLGKKRAGYQTVTGWSSYNIRGGLEYKNVDGNRQNLIYGEASILTGSSGIWGTFSGTGLPTTLRSGLLDGVKPSMCQYRSLAFLFNGQNNLLFDGNSVRQIGIDAPTTAPTFITNISGEQVPSGSYLFAYSYYNSQTGAESNLSPISDSFVAGATASLAGFRIGVTAGSSITADKIRIYRSFSGGQILFFEDEINISDTSFDSVALDAGLGVEAELDNSRLSEAAKFGIVADNRLFVGGFPSNPNRVQFSKVGISGPMPESFQALDFIDCNINDGDRVLGLGKAGDNVIIVKERSVGRLVRVAAETGGLERQGSVKYLYEEISSKVTGLSHHLIVSLDNIVIWFGRDDIYGTDGSQVFRFGKRVRNTIKALDFNLAHKWSSLVKTDSQQIMFAVTKDGKNECDFQLVGHYRNFPKIAFTFYTAGPDPTTHPGLIVGSFFEVTINGLTKFYFGSANASGKIFKMDIGDNDNGSAIYWKMGLPWDGGRQKMAKKHFHSYYLFAAGAGIAPNNTIIHKLETNTNASTAATATSTLIGNNPLWSSVNWGSFNWADVTFNPLKFFPNKKAYFARYTWENTFADQPVAVRALAGVWQPCHLH